MSDPRTIHFVAQLEKQIDAINSQIATAPEEHRQPIGYAITQIRDDIATINQPAQLQKLAEHYRTDQASRPAALRLIRNQLVQRIDRHFEGSSVTRHVEHPIEQSMQAPPVAEAPAPIRNEPQPKRPPREHAPQHNELVVFRNGEQNRWGIVEQRGNLYPSDNKYEDPSGWRLRPNMQGSHYRVRVSGVPLVIPATTITHTIDPRQQPDLPIDSFIERGSIALRVQAISWGDDATRLSNLVTGKPALLRMGHVADNLDLRDGIGTSMERPQNDLRTERSPQHRDDQQPDVDFIRSNPKTSEQHRQRHIHATPEAEQLPTAGPQAMQWAANIDKVDPNQIRIIVAGPTNLGPESAIHIKQELQSQLAHIDPSKITIVHGGSKGVDRYAVEAARELGMRTEVHLADWDLHQRSAPRLRNQQMIDAGASRIIAFADKPLDEIPATKDLLQRAHTKGMPTSIVSIPTALAAQPPTNNITASTSPVQPSRTISG